jgi:putative transposase
METKKTRYAHYNINYHVVWISKYRRRVLTGTVKELIEKTILEKAIALDVQVLEIQVTEDHIHLFVSAPPRYSPSEIVGSFKGKTSREARKAFPHLRRVNKDSLWTGTYHVGTAGTVSSETIKRYIQEQSS